MSGCLRQPWIEPTICDFLARQVDNPAAPETTSDGDLAFLVERPRCVQIVNFVTFADPICATVSDKYLTVDAQFSSSSVAKHKEDHGRSLTAANGTLIQIRKLRVVFLDSNGDEFIRKASFDQQAPERCGKRSSSAVEDASMSDEINLNALPAPRVLLLIEEFGHVGADNSAIIGKPKPVDSAMKVGKLLRLLPRRDKNTSSIISSMRAPPGDVQPREDDSGNESDAESEASSLQSQVRTDHAGDDVPSQFATQVKRRSSPRRVSRKRYEGLDFGSSPPRVIEHPPTSTCSFKSSISVEIPARQEKPVVRPQRSNYDQGFDDAGSVERSTEYKGTQHSSPRTSVAHEKPPTVDEAQLRAVSANSTSSGTTPNKIARRSQSPTQLTQGKMLARKGTEWDDMADVSRKQARVPREQRDILETGKAWYPPIQRRKLESGYDAVSKVQLVPKTHDPLPPLPNVGTQPQQSQTSFLPVVEVPLRDPLVVYSQHEDASDSDAPFPWSPSNPATPHRQRGDFNAMPPDSSAPSVISQGKQRRKQNRNQSSPQGVSSDEAASRTDQELMDNSRERRSTRLSHGISKPRVPFQQEHQGHKPRSTKKKPSRACRKRTATVRLSDGEYSSSSSSAPNRDPSVEPPFKKINPHGLTRRAQYGTLRSQQVTEWEVQAKKRAESAESVNSDSDSDVDQADTEDVDELEGKFEGINGRELSDRDLQPNINEKTNPSEGRIRTCTGNNTPVNKNERSRPIGSEALLDIQKDMGKPLLDGDATSTAHQATHRQNEANKENDDVDEDEDDISIAPPVPFNTQKPSGWAGTIKATCSQGIQKIADIFSRNDKSSGSTPKGRATSVPTAATTAGSQPPVIQVIETPYRRATSSSRLRPVNNEDLSHAARECKDQLSEDEAERIIESSLEGEKAGSQNQPHAPRSQLSSPIPVVSGKPVCVDYGPGQANQMSHKKTDTYFRREFKTRTPKNRKAMKKAGFASQEIREVQHHNMPALLKEQQLHFLGQENGGKSPTGTYSPSAAARKRPSTLSLSTPNRAKVRRTHYQDLAAALSKSFGPLRSSGIPFQSSTASRLGSGSENESFTSDEPDIIPAFGEVPSPPGPIGLWQSRSTLNRPPNLSDEEAPGSMQHPRAEPLGNLPCTARIRDAGNYHRESSIRFDGTSGQERLERLLYAGIRERVLKVPGYEIFTDCQREELDRKRKAFFGVPSNGVFDELSRWRRGDAPPEPLRKRAKTEPESSWYLNPDTPMKMFVEQYGKLKQVRHELAGGTG